MEDNIKVLIPEAELVDKIKEMAEQINKDYNGEPLHLVCILKGSVFFTCELAKYLTMPVTMDFMAVSSYKNALKSSGVIEITKDLDPTDPIEGKNILVIEDIIDSGNTLSWLLNNLSQRNPKSLKLCTLLDKPARRQTPVEVDYTGFEVPDLFVVGFGLDAAQKYRNFPYIAVIE